MSGGVSLSDDGSKRLSVPSLCSRSLISKSVDVFTPAHSLQPDLAREARDWLAPLVYQLSHSL